VSWIALKGRNYGIARVTLDDGKPVDVDLYSADFLWKQHVWNTGLLSPGEHTDNDYFISNVNPMLRTFTVSPAATFFDDTGVTGVPITWETFLGYWTGDPAGAAHKRAAPWWIERDGITVVKVNQQYLP